MSAAPLTRVLGLGFSIALAFGNTIGVGILRLPGEVAAALGDVKLIVLAWVAGGVYALLGAISIGELAAMLPAAGGFYVYSRRAFGAGCGFLVGWSDWLANNAAVAYAALAAAEFLVQLFPGLAGHNQAMALLIVAAFTAVHWLGIRIGSSVQNAISVFAGLLLIALAAACFLVTPQAAVATTGAAIGASSIGSVGLLAAVVIALRSVIVTYDGWYGSIYLAGETVDAPRNLPRAMIGCALLVTTLYVLINLGLLHALSLPALATSKLPAADAARYIFPHGGGTFVTVASIFIMFSLINAVLLGAPRILYAIGRDGLIPDRAARVSASGTPRAALGITASVVALLILSGTVEQMVAIAALFYVLNYISGYAALVTLRVREPELLRPYRAWGFPWTTGLVLIGSIVFLVLAAMDDHRSALFAAALLLVAVPVYALGRHRQKQQSTA